MHAIEPRYGEGTGAGSNIPPSYSKLRLIRAMHLTQLLNQIPLSPFVKGGKRGISRAVSLKTTMYRQSSNRLSHVHTPITN